MLRLFAFLLLSTTCINHLYAEEKIHVVVSVIPNKVFVEHIGGDQVSVVSLVKPGETPETFSPSPRQITELATADLYVRTGVEFENAWIPRVVAVNPEIQILDLRKGLTASNARAKDIDPHIWTSPKLVRVMATHIRDQLIQLSPEHEPIFRKNTAQFDQKLADLDQTIKSELATLKHRAFIVFHPAWGHFAQSYDLTQVSLERHGKEPGAKYIASIIADNKNRRIKFVFKQPSIMHRAMDRIAEALNARIEILDPLAEDYFSNLQRVAQLISKANQ